MAQTVLTTGGGSGPQITLATGEDLLIVEGVQVFSDDDSVIEGTGRNDIFLSANAGIFTFTDSTVEPAILLATATAPVSNNTIYISASASVVSTGDAIESYGASSEVTNHGTIAAEQTAVDLLESNNTFTNFGSVNGANNIGVRVWANGTVANFGEIFGGFWGIVTREGGGEVQNIGKIAGNTGVYLGGASDDPTNVLNNSGEIQGEAHGVNTVTANSVIVNSGVIQSAVPIAATILQSSSVVQGKFDLWNSGDILSAGFAYQGAAGQDSIQNTGLISGDVRLGSGDDKLQSRNGIMDGDVFGEGGADTLTGGDADEELNGGSGDDVLKGRRGEDRLVGGADKDELHGGKDDDVLDGGSGKDELRGGSGDDALSGGGGSDSLFGGNGNDTLNGGDGRDELVGGLGVDTFVFKDLSHSIAGGDRDVIREFEAGKGEIIDLAGVSAGTIDFVGTDAFSASGSSELRLTDLGDGRTRISIDDDGDGVREFQIDITNLVGTLAEDNFVL